MKAAWIERALLVAAIGWSWFSWVHAQEADRQRIIASENAYAAGDTVRTLRDSHARDSAGYAVSLHQRDVALDGMVKRLAKAEGLNARLHAQLAVATRGLDTVVVGVAAPVADTGGRLVDSVQVTGPPITGTVTADLAPWRPTTWGLRLKPDPIPLTVVIGCRKGLPPSILITSPEWVQVYPNGVLSPELCHPRPQRARWPWFLGGIGLGIVGWELLR